MLRLRLLEQKSYDDLAEALGLKPEAVRKRYSRALKVLLAPEPGEDGVRA